MTRDEIDNLIKNDIGWAIDRGTAKDVRDLLSRKPELTNWQDEYGQTTLIYAVSNNNPDMVKAVLDAGAPITGKEYEYLPRRGYKTVKRLLDKRREQDASRLAKLAMV